MNKKGVAIVVGGGPAPGINGVIGAAAIEAINRGHKVFGIRKGFELISKGDLSAISELTIPDVSRIHYDGGSVLLTSRANPTKDPQMLDNVIKTLNSIGAGYLVTIGGDDTASSARAVAQAANGSVAVAHVPKTIDNDLPLPGKQPTFGFESARQAGTEIVETLMVDARTTSRWYLVIAMGRKAGHLALGIGIAAGATLTIIPEEIGDRQISLARLADIIVGSILKRKALGRPYGVAVLAEGLAEKLDKESIPELQTAERDPHGHIRFSEIEFGGMIKNAVRRRLKELEVSGVRVVDKNVGYELRCQQPTPFDMEYTRQLGFGVIDFLLGGGSQAMITRQGDALIPVPFSDFIDPSTGRAQVRLVDTESIVYKVARQYQIRLTSPDLNDDTMASKIAGLTNRPLTEIRELFRESASGFKAYPQQLQPQ